MRYYLLFLFSVFALSSCEQDPEIIGLDANKKQTKFDVCHYDPVTDSYTSLSLTENALKAHLNHGDELGICPDAKTYVPDDVFERYLINRRLDDVMDDYVLTKNIVEVKYIKFYDDLCDDGYSNCLESLIGIEDFASLETLDIQNEYPLPLSSLDLSKNVNLKYLWLENFPMLTELKLDKNINLTSLGIVDAGIQNLNLKKNVSLTGLGIRNIPITKLDISENTSLIGLELGYVNFSEIDLSNNTNLIYVDLFGNQFDQLDFSNNVNLERISLVNQVYDFIDFSSNTLLKSLSLENCTFNEVDLSANTNLIGVAFFNVTIPFINLKNGNNTNISNVYARATDSNDIDCMQVDNVAFSITNWTACDPNILSEDCGY